MTEKLAYYISAD